MTVNLVLSLSCSSHWENWGCVIRAGVGLESCWKSKLGGRDHSKWVIGFVYCIRYLRG